MENKTGLGSIIDNAIKVITNPVGFYRDMPKTGGYADPVVFVLVMAVIMGLAVAIFSLFGAGMVGAMAAGMGAVIILPIFALIGSFIGAAVLFVIWRLMGSDQSYETAYRCMAYAAAIYPVTAVIGLIPYIGSIIGVVWGMYLMITASIEVHGLARTTAYTVFGVLGAIGLVINVGNEIAMRKAMSHLDEMSSSLEQLGKQYGQSGEIDAQEAGRAMGNFFKGIQDAAQNQARQPATGSPPPTTPTDASAPDQQITPEQAGKALGDFFKGLNDATQGMGTTGQDSAPVPAPVQEFTSTAPSSAVDAVQ